MSVVPRLLRIAANAGSGKTFALSGRYLALVRDNAAPNEILATTFTRKAAGEIRDRVLGRLASAAIDDDKLKELQESLPGASAAEATELLERLVAHLDRLQVRTLDSFFASVALVSAGELGLPSDAQPIDPALDVALATGAIARAADGDRDSVIATLDALTKGRAKSMLNDAIERETRGLEPLWRDSAADAWCWNRHEALDLPELLALVARLRAARVHATGGLQKEIDRDINELPLLPPTDPFAWAARAGKGILKKALENSWSFKRQALHPDLIAIYRELAVNANALEWNELVRRTEATATLLASYVTALDDMRRDLGVVTFDDITRAVASAADSEMSELFFRLDGRIAHLLLDEFQDTSATQWRALRPIAGEIVAQDERTLFVVGDLKQSIYRWRGASPDIMEAIESSINEGNVPIDRQALTDSYRSSPDILAAVDDVFAALPSNPAIAAPSNGARYIRAARRWCDRYATHNAIRGFPGVVELHATKPGADAKELLEFALDHAADLIEELTRTAPNASIGVLAWRTQAVTGVLRRLRDRGIPASGMGRGALTDAPIVNAMLAALLFAQHPDDTIACFHASRAPLGAVLQLEAGLHRKALMADRRDASARLRAELWRDGPAECVQRWARALDGHVDPREARRLEQLVEGLAAIEASGGEVIGVVDLDRVVDALRSLDVEEPGGGSVEVLTVYRAKGLEFDLVVVVDLDKAFKVADAIAWKRDTPSGPIVRALRWPGSDSNLDDAKELIDASIEGRYREALSTLYVALTRAKRGLFAITAPVEANDEGDPKWKDSLAHVLRAAWSPNDLDASCVRVRGDRSAIASGLEVAAEPASSRLPNFALAPRQQRWEVAARAASDISGFVDLDLGADLERDRGIAAHAALAAVEWDAPNSDVLLRASRAARPRRSEQWHREIVAMVERAIASASLREHFTQRGLYARAERELRFARVLVDEGVQVGSIDRVVLGQDSKGRSIATIIDFKTGTVDASSAAERAKEYRTQLAAYREAVVERFGLTPKDVRCVIAFLEPALCVNVDVD